MNKASQKKTIQSKILVNKTTFVKDMQDDELKMSKVQKEIRSLNLNIKYLIQQKILKDNFKKVLSKQRDKLQNSIFNKKLRLDTKQNKITQQNSLLNKNHKNLFHNVNQPLKKLIQIAQKDSFSSINQSQQIQTSQLSVSNPACQSSHINSIFHFQSQSIHQQRLAVLKSKLSLLHSKIKTNLQKQEPYVWQKIYERIKRQAQKQGKLRVLIELQKIIKQNSAWIQQQTAIVDNVLKQQEMEQICVTNLQKMKRLMNKKVSNNDYIYENYSQQQNKQKKSINMKSLIPLQRIKDQLRGSVQSLHEELILDELSLMKKEGNSDEMNKREYSLQKRLSNPVLINILRNSEQRQNDEFNQCISELMKKCSQIEGKIQKLNTK